MHSLRTIFGSKAAQRGLALLGCLALLYFVAGSTLHSHTASGPDTPCHICQALHMPALAAAPLGLIHEAQQVTWHASLPLNAVPSDSFALHRASRAPPVQA